MAVTSTIVNVEAQVTSAPAPSTLQQSGACISVNATISPVTNAYAYYPTLTSALAAIGTTGNYVELTNMVTEFFDQASASNSPIGVSILELGNLSASAAITALGTWITANPNIFYAFLVPATWDSTTAMNMNTMAAGFSSPVSKTYFFVTTTGGHLSEYDAVNKALFCVVPSPTAGETEFQAAAPFYQFLVNNPSASNQLAPMAFRFLYDVTPWNLVNNITGIDNILTAYGNIILSGAEGGISTATLRNGTMIDGNQADFWYSIDWTLIQAKIRLANAILNGSNQQPPLTYSQAGINTLLGVLNNMGISAIAFDIAEAISFAAIPFQTYTSENPSNYAAGIYNGFSCTLTPQLGFLSVTFYLNATQFAV